MNKNNLIRLVQSLIFLPSFIVGAAPLGSVIKDVVVETAPSVFIEKENNDIEADGLIAFNQVMADRALAQKITTLKAEAIDDYFASRDMPLLGLGVKMVEEAEKYNLDWRLIPAIAIRESSGGKFECIKADFNSFGWGSCKISFQSNEEAIEIIAKNLGGKNPNTAKHYHDKTTKQILQSYNPPSVIPRYAEQVISIMNTIGPEEIKPLEEEQVLI